MIVLEVTAEMKMGVIVTEEALDLLLIIAEIQMKAVVLGKVALGIVVVETEVGKMDGDDGVMTVKMGLVGRGSEGRSREGRDGKAVGQYLKGTEK